MQYFRTHIIKWLVSFLLTVGMAVHIAIPYSSEAQKNAFDQWLDRNVVENGEESESTIRAHIKKLPAQTENFPLLLEQASMLVVNHKNDFKLPLRKESKDAGSISLWLFGKWTQSQNETGSMDALLPETLKPGLKWTLQNNPLATYPGSSGAIQLPEFSEILNDILLVIQNKPVPFLSGISINAP
jgi:hypothetical protein